MFSDSLIWYAGNGAPQIAKTRLGLWLKLPERGQSFEIFVLLGRFTSWFEAWSESVPTFVVDGDADSVKIQTRNDTLRLEGADQTICWE